MGNPKAIIVLAGKRKSGKDYIADRFKERFSDDQLAVFRIAGPIKKAYADQNGLDYERLLDASDYKELHREKMVSWADEIRCHDPTYFLRLAIEQANAHQKPIWMLTDARREPDIKFFKLDDRFKDKTILIKIKASEETRTERGWIFTVGIDDQETECGLDNFHNYDVIIENEPHTQDKVNNQLNEIFKRIENALQP